ncbi:MAG: two-component system C4-dicarboxylate transport sensor histidine kinase DctB [Paracoccaceae bacterium]|jgi:two-component system C4-dicarboxylate transport sensor histidine kinase DctB
MNWRSLRPVKVRNKTGARAWIMRGVVLIFVSVAVSVIWISNLLLTERFTETTRVRAELRLALYSGSIVSELQRNSVVPLLLSRDPLLIRALASGDFTSTSQRLISYREEIGAESIMLLNRDGRVVAATDRARLGEFQRNDPQFVNALRNDETVFTNAESDSGLFNFSFSRRVEDENQLGGVIVVTVDLRRLEERWGGTADAVIVSNSEGQIVLTTEPRWRGLTEAEAIAVRSPPSAIRRAIDATGDWGFGGLDPYFSADAMMRLEARIPFRGWRITAFTAHASVRERVNGILALEIMGFALLLAGAFYVLSRRSRLQSVVFQRESAELRRLNLRLQREIAERQKVEKTLKEAEQSLAQSSKLAALGEMSAAVSHELNQPLAAMKTYLAGAKLLLQRRRPEEALSSFQRIDDLIERMGAITRQLKSYARKGGEAFEPVDMKEALAGALTMMEPQLRQMTVQITQQVPRGPVMILADRLRLEQVIINLLRNALDAMKGDDVRELDLILTIGDEAVLTVRDSGKGIDDLGALFEPFYTTKRPGDGVGLGLAISSGIVGDLGGRLTARNGEQRGAVFDVRLPLLDQGSAAAE